MLTILTTVVALAASAPQAIPETKELALDAPIAAVTVYRDRAMVTRSCALPAEQGAYEIRIEGLPKSIDGESLTARVDGAKLLDVRFERIVRAVDASTSPELRKAIADLDAAERAGELLALRTAKISDQNALLNSIAAKTATESAKDFGSKALDPDALARQVEFLAQARDRLIAERTTLDAEVRANQAERKALSETVRSLGGKTLESRAAVVTVGKAQPGAATLSVMYLVGGAGWSPRYAIRAVDSGDDAADSLTVEFNAEIAQATGEDWTEVAMTMSTAEPTRRPAPGEVPSEYLDVRRPPEELETYGLAAGTGGMGGGGSMARKMDGEPGWDARPGAPAPASGVPGGPGGAFGDPGSAVEKLGIALEAEFADAEATGGAVVNYPVARKVSVPSDDRRTRTQRIATVELQPAFSHVARPIIDPVVYLRAKARNTSAFRLIEGEARIFVGDDSVGTTTLPTLSPGAEATFWLGGDSRIESKRVLVAKESKTEGLFGKSDVLVEKWRIDLVSAAPGASRVELSDRIPVSRNEQIKVELKDLSAPLSTADSYLKNERVRGVLTWIVELPGRGKDGKPAERSVSWTMQRSHPAEIAVDAETEPVG